ncbi:uncharacterized protein LOC126705187 [Quercus robur]|uniref:uncharacterized protein LOC126705187 n=3 Tax=Quercus robur TaxID=38942 RepID=UPI002161BD84|nr:uncharacterized protein LOC126705187 [Quercus robur]
MENPQHLPTSVAVHEHFEKDQEPVIERSEHDESSENLTSTKYIDPSRVEDSSNLQDLAVLEVELTVSEPSALTVSLHSCWPFANGDWYSFCVNHKLLLEDLSLSALTAAVSISVVLLRSVLSTMLEPQKPDCHPLIMGKEERLCVLSWWLIASYARIENHAEHGGTLNEHQLNRLHSILKPFMLRRVKTDVISELTRKTEVTVHCKLSSRQQAFYQAIKNKISLAELFEGNRGHLNEKKILNLMNIVIQLRKVCNHPELFERNEGRTYLHFGEIPNSLLPPPFGELEDVHYAGVTDCISQVLGLHILGWLGRLAFPPPRCLLVLPPRPLSCGVFPNFDSIFVPRDKDVSNCEGSADLHHSPSIVEFDETSSQISCRDAQSSSELSIPKSPPALLKGSVTTLNVDVLEQTVLHVQNQLLTRLESMNPLQHESMTQGEIHHVVNPDPYHGVFGSDANRYAKDLQDHIDFGTSGKVAGFIAETIQGAGGAVELAPGYLKLVYDIVRKAGGVCIVDEVQTGFGRTGSNYWGFETQGVIPDIFTMAKGIGNGLPLGAVVTTPEIASVLAQKIQFNTFGGNPVCSAGGLAVLRVIDQEKRQAHCADVGSHLLKRLRALQQTHESNYS